MDSNRQEIIDRLDAKFKAIDQDTNVHLEGLVWAKPITYWDYIHTDALLSLQLQRTTLPDEMVFIMYHQVNELLFKMILWEIDQVAKCETVTAAFFSEKLMRISRYFDVLSMSFNIMNDGMHTDQYLKFRNTLTPASGFQSAQYRFIEFASTDRENLIDARFRTTIDNDATDAIAFEHLYWQAAGKNHATGGKTTLIRLFEERYKDEFLRRMHEYRDINLYAKFRCLPPEEQANKALIDAMRHYDHTVNITWVMAHYHAAEKYLESGQKTEGTGGSNWKKYMHPRYQRRIFFPSLWTDEEKENWGVGV